MKPFLKEVAQYFFNHLEKPLDTYCVVLPSKRGALFLKQHIANVYQETTWLPTILTAEQLIEELSELSVLNDIDLVCHLYESYKFCYGDGAEPFDSFLKWGHLILQDFNEIDRYLADSKQLYDNLQHIKEIENWSLGETELSEMQLNYLHFMQSLGKIYVHFTEFLIKNGWAYQGLAYKIAVTKLNSSVLPNKFRRFVFCGFNALNAAEIKIIKYLQTSGKAELLWDADTYYLNNQSHEAGLFLRQNLSLFGSFKHIDIGENFKKDKNIKLISVPKQIGQAQVVKQEVQKLIDAGINLKDVAIVLANEKLLWPVLNQLPAGVQHVNITMEYPIKFTSAYNLLEQLIKLQIGLKNQKYKGRVYYKDLNDLLLHPLFANYLQLKHDTLNIPQVLHNLKLRNIAFLNKSIIQSLFENAFNVIKPFVSIHDNVKDFNLTLSYLIDELIDQLTVQTQNALTVLELQYLTVIKKNLNRMSEIVGTENYFNDLSSYKQLFQQIIGSGSVPFIGEPLKGLQLMGVLETRTLDFKHIIFVNVNEGILPASKNSNSFLPNDLKRAFGLPLYTEKAAIYAYHFYRLLQRAEQICITYDSVTDTFGKGEKSRFLTQLLIELPAYSNNIQIIEQVAEYKEAPSQLQNNIIIQKNEVTIQPILKKITSADNFSGLSASALNTFSDCSLKFFFRYGARLKEPEQLEEYAESNTQGQILHLALENLYKPLVNQILKADSIKQLRSLVDNEVNVSFHKFFEQKELYGKNLLQKEVVKSHVLSQLDRDEKNCLKAIENNHPITLLGVEYTLTSSLKVSINGESHEVWIKGTIDRIEKKGNDIEISDYKNAVKDTDKFEVDLEFSDLFTNPKYHKQFQLIVYSWLLYKTNLYDPEQIKPCIIAFKSKKDNTFYLKQNRKSFVFSAAFFEEFETALILRIQDLLSYDTTFKQTSDTEICSFCAYNIICNKI